jgi:hypothetical protein
LSEVRINIFSPFMFRNRPSNMINKFLFSLALNERTNSMYQLINYDPKWPYVCLFTIIIENNSLGRHIMRRAYIQIMKSLSKYFYILLIKFGKSKISYLHLSIVYENVSRFQVTVSDPFFTQVFEPVVEIQYDRTKLVLSEWDFAFDSVV